MLIVLNYDIIVVHSDSMLLDRFFPHSLVEDRYNKKGIGRGK